MAKWIIKAVIFYSKQMPEEGMCLLRRSGFLFYVKLFSTALDPGITRVSFMRDNWKEWFPRIFFFFWFCFSLLFVKFVFGLLGWRWISKVLSLGFKKSFDFSYQGIDVWVYLAVSNRQAGMILLLFFRKLHPRHPYSSTPS